MNFFDGLGTLLGSENAREQILRNLLDHCYLALLPLLLGGALGIALGWLGRGRARMRAVLFGVSNLVYTVPSLALFVLLPGIIGTQITSSANIVAALSLYTAALLVRPVIGALEAVPPHVLASATAMGYRPARKFFAVELPLAVPVLAAGVRVASVSNISLVSVGAIIGTGGLGVLFTDGFQRVYYAPIVVGIVLTLVLALVVDLLIVLLRNVLTPWERPAPVEAEVSTT